MNYHPFWFINNSYIIIFIIFNGEIRPGIVHRIDMDTSGLLMVAKNDIAHRGLDLAINCSTKPRCAMSFLATINKPDVSISIRCTIPGRR
jgi:23S rRNA-/tRNA-specific pseudouridylate synthase